MTSKKVKIDFCLPQFSATKKVTWKFYVNESTNIRYNMILSGDLLTALVLDLKFSEKDHNWRRRTKLRMICTNGGCKQLRL